MELRIGADVRHYIPPNSAAIELLDSSGNTVFKIDTRSGGANVFNEAGSDIDFRVEADANTGAFVVDAGAHTGVGAIGLGAAPAASPVGYVTVNPPAMTATASTSFGRVNIENAAAVTIPAGTTAVVASLFVGEPNITATGTVTVAATVYVEAAPTEGSSNYAVWVDAGATRLDGDLTVGGAAVTGARNTLSYAAAGTVVTSVGYGLHMPAVTYVDAGATGTIAVLALANIGVPTVQATNTITYTDVAALQVGDPVASTGATFTRKYAIRALGQVFTSTNVQIGGNTAAFASTQPTGAAVFAGGATAPAGAIVEGGAIFSSTTVMRKIIADGTASNIET